MDDNYHSSGSLFPGIEPLSSAQFQYYINLLTAYLRSPNAFAEEGIVVYHHRVLRVYTADRVKSHAQVYIRLQDYLNYQKRVENMLLADKTASVQFANQFFDSL